MRLILAAALALALCSCDDPQGAERTARQMGFHDVQAHGYPWLFSGCADSDVWATKFTAVNADGMAVSGVVCRGWFKRSTVRLD